MSKKNINLERDFQGAFRRSREYNATRQADMAKKRKRVKATTTRINAGALEFEGNMYAGGLVPPEVRQEAKKRKQEEAKAKALEAAKKANSAKKPASKGQAKADKAKARLKADYEAGRLKGEDLRAAHLLFG